MTAEPAFAWQYKPRDGAPAARFHATQQSAAAGRALCSA